MEGIFCAILFQRMGNCVICFQQIVWIFLSVFSSAKRYTGGEHHDY